MVGRQRNFEAHRRYLFQSCSSSLSPHPGNTGQYACQRVANAIHHAVRLLDRRSRQTLGEVHARHLHGDCVADSARALFPARRSHINAIENTIELDYEVVDVDAEGRRQVVNEVPLEVGTGGSGVVQQPLQHVVDVLGTVR